MSGDNVDNNIDGLMESVKKLNLRRSSSQHTEKKLFKTNDDRSISLITMRDDCSSDFGPFMENCTFTDFSFRNQSSNISRLNDMHAVCQSITKEIKERRLSKIESN